jgi:hypothetical protein
VTVERRKGLNEARFREVNEAIERGHPAQGVDEPVAFSCECGVLGCNVLVELTVVEYEAVRADARRFLLVPGHDDPEVERVVLQRPDYVVVEKFGEAGRAAESTDPRHR